MAPETLVGDVALTTLPLLFSMVSFVKPICWVKECWRSPYSLVFHLQKLDLLVVYNKSIIFFHPISSHVLFEILPNSQLSWYDTKFYGNQSCSFSDPTVAGRVAEIFFTALRDAASRGLDVVLLVDYIGAFALRQVAWKKMWVPSYGWYMLNCVDICWYMLVFIIFHRYSRVFIINS